MINLNDKVKVLFPELYTKQGKLKRREPHKYICPNCSTEFSKTQKLDFAWISFGLKTCTNCGHKGEDSVKYNVWKRISNGEIEVEDFILNTIIKHREILQDDLKELVIEKFGNNVKNFSSVKGLGTLVYYGYLAVDADKRDNEGVVVYSIGKKKDLENRFELIR